MTRWISLGALVAAVATVSVAACGDDTNDAAGSPDGGTTPSPTTPGPTPDGGPAPDGSAPDAGRRSCLDRPNTLATPPASGLPCELIPPGLTL